VDATQAAEAIAAWAADTCDALNNVYEYDTARIAAALPVAIAAVGSEHTTSSDPTLGIPVATLGLDQATLHVLRIDLALLVTPTDDDTAAKQLEGFVRDLRDDLLVDPTLGGRVSAASPYWQASYEPPFLKFDDSTEARAATFSLAVAELI
jgi:hypothetical protein